MAILGLCLVFLWPMAEALDLEQLSQSWRAIAPTDWIMACVFTLISFLGIGQYDVIAHRQLDTGLPAEHARISGMTAIALPACTAALVLLVRPARTQMWRDPEPPRLHEAPRAETAVICQNGGAIELLGATYAALWPTGQALVSIFDPFDAPGQDFFACLANRARERNRVALIYKAGARTARAARQAGWVCLHGADDAILDLARFTLQTPERAGLRRKLRKAAKAGVTIREMRPVDMPQMAEVDADWQASQGRARGGSMGRFCPAYLTGQRVLVAETHGRIIAFVSLQRCAREWALDLMRQERNAPDGTMHALVHAGIEAAAKTGVQQFSLAAVPACADPRSAFWRLVAFRIANMSRSAGLRQFKSSFAPRWQPLYLAAPSRVALAVAALDIAREVFLPSRLPEHAGKTAAATMTEAHKEDEHYEVASPAAA